MRFAWSADGFSDEIVPGKDFGHFKPNLQWGVGNVALPWRPATLYDARRCAVRH